MKEKVNFLSYFCHPSFSASPNPFFPSCCFPLECNNLIYHRHFCSSVISPSWLLTWFPVSCLQSPFLALALSLFVVKLNSLFSSVASFYSFNMVLSLSLPLFFSTPFLCHFLSSPLPLRLSPSSFFTYFSCLSHPLQTNLSIFKPGFLLFFL